MKKIIYLLFAVIFSSSVFTQAPESFSYQAVVRNVDGSLIENTEVGIKISILAGSASGTVVCEEEFTPTTNNNGLVTLQIGSVSTTDFQSIDWSYQDYFVKVELDPEGGTSYTEMGTSQLLSVPYALYAKNAGKNLYFKDGKVGIGSSDPKRLLLLDNKSESCYMGFQTNTSGNSILDGFILGISYSNNDVYFWNYEEAQINIGTNNTTQMIITEVGDVGIGTTSPDAKLDVDGSSKFGSNGVVFQEMREITGVTDDINNYVIISLPAGYNEDNTRILNIEINYAGDRWTGIGSDNVSESHNSVSYIINNTNLYVYYPNLGSYKEKALRALIMRINPL